MFAHFTRFSPAIFLIFALITFSCSSGVTEYSNQTRAEKNTEVPADRKIAEAERRTRAFPDLAKSHNLLASAYLQKVRETGDYSLNRLAEESIERAFAIDPENFASYVLKAQILLSEHEFGEALALAERLEKDYPQNQIVLTIKTDAQTELGRYEDAVLTAQQLVDLRPNASSFTRVARLRSLHGDPEGAIEARRKAVKMADPTDKENLAWFHCELGREYFEIAKYEEAAAVYDRALQIFPDYFRALEGKGKSLAALGDLTGAASYLERIAVPETAREIYLADIYNVTGQRDKALEMYTSIAARENNKPAGDMHRIALLWADHGRNLSEALEIARKDRAENADLAASDTLAWCLYKNGDYKEAKEYVAEAMRLNTKSALFFYHAGMIELALDNEKEAVRLLELALATNPAFDLVQAETARKTLRDL